LLVLQDQIAKLFILVRAFFYNKNKTKKNKNNRTKAKQQKVTKKLCIILEHVPWNVVYFRHGIPQKKLKLIDFHCVSVL